MKGPTGLTPGSLNESAPDQLSGTESFGLRAGGRRFKSCLPDLIAQTIAAAVLTG
jgi:hypothetical protein